jgi:hypothetical protein
MFVKKPLAEELPWAAACGGDPYPSHEHHQWTAKELVSQ